MLRLSESQLAAIYARREKGTIDTNYDLNASATWALTLAARCRAEKALTIGLNLGIRALNDRRMRTPYENIEQIISLIWLASEAPEAYLMTTAIPMGGYRPKGAGGQMKAEGARPGFPDLLMDIARKGAHGLRIEMKRFDKSAVPSKDQVGWLRRLTNEGYRAYSCRGHRAAINVMADYLDLDKPFSNDELPSWATLNY